MTHHAFTALPPDARARLHRLYRLGAASPYMIDRMQAEFGRHLPDYSPHFRDYAEANGLPWHGTHGLRYSVAAILDPERPWRGTFREMVLRREPYEAIVRVLRDEGAPLCPDSDGTIRSAISRAGWEYQPHTRGGYWGRMKRTYGPCPRCGEIIQRPSRKFCSAACAKAARREGLICRSKR